MAHNVPILYQDRDTFIHRRDPRVKLLLLILLFIFLFSAPTWQWMLVPVGLGLLIALIAKTSWKWLLALWALHLPSFIVLVLVPSLEHLIAGEHGKALETVEGELRLVLAWTGAIFVSVSLFSTIDPNGLKNGMLGLGFPPIVAFAVGLSYRMLYVTLNEIVEIANAMRLKGLDSNWKRPLRFVKNSLKISLPVLFAVLRRGPTLMCVLDMRGFARRAQLERLDAGDLTFGACGAIAFLLPLGQRLQLTQGLEAMWNTLQSGIGL